MAATTFMFHSTFKSRASKNLQCFLKERKSPCHFLLRESLQFFSYFLLLHSLNYFLFCFHCYHSMLLSSTSYIMATFTLASGHPGLEMESQHYRTRHCGLASESCLALVGPVGCSPPGSSVHEISQARILERLAFPGNLPWKDTGVGSFSRESS